MVYLATCVNIDNVDMHFYYKDGYIHLFRLIDTECYHYTGNIDEILGYTEEFSHIHIGYVLPETKRYIIYRRELLLIIEQIIFEKI
jgi:hypothetical protein